MHPLHLRYVCEEPRWQSCARLFHHLSDLVSADRRILLRETYSSFLVYPTDETEAECLQELALRLGRIAFLMPSEQPFAYGIVCYILGNALDRFTKRIPSLIVSLESKQEILGDLTSSLDALRDEEYVLQEAYKSFCELVVARLLKASPSDSFDDDCPDEGDITDCETALTRELSDDENVDKPEPLTLDQIDLVQLANLLFPCEDGCSDHSLEIAFFDQLSTLLANDAVQSNTNVVVRVGVHAVQVSVGPYCVPSTAVPDCPRIMRLRIGHVTEADKQALEKLGLKYTLDLSLPTGLEFSVLPRELSQLVEWTASWIRGQASESPVPPSLPIQIAGEVDEDNPHTEAAAYRDVFAAKASAAFTDFGANWRSVNYLWSRAARESYDAWEAKQEDQNDDDD